MLISGHFCLIFLVWILSFESSLSLTQQYRRLKNKYLDSLRMKNPQMYTQNKRTIARFKHGDPSNLKKGGSCSQFKLINSLNRCCHSRNDECYMVHYDSRCYCDTFCAKEVNKNVTDCCPDAIGPSGVCSATSYQLYSTKTKCKQPFWWFNCLKYTLLYLLTLKSLLLSRVKPQTRT